MVYFLIIVNFFVIGIALNFFLNCFFFRKPKVKSASGADHDDAALVSILVPARNEAARIGNCLKSLLAQSYAQFEIIILDDHSTDDTKKVVMQFIQRDTRVRLLDGKALESGWTGKGWACQQLGAQAQGEYFLFTDADTWHDAAALECALSEVQRHKIDLLSLWPRQVTGTWSEVLVIPFVHVLLLFFLPHWMPGKFRSLGAANGQYLLFSRKAYEVIGGHTVVKGHLVDDVALAREIKVRGLNLVNLDGSDLVRCRMYESVRQVWEGFTKNLRAGFEDSLAAFLFLFILQSLVLCLPFFLLLGLYWAPELMLWVLFPVVTIMVLRLVLALKCRQPIVSVWLHPLGQLFVLAIALNSWIKTAQGKVIWKDRTY